jgi:hypothetical protein
MKVLFAALHFAQFRNFDSVVRELAARGHQVHMAAEEPESLGGEQLVAQLAAEHPGVTRDLLPSLEDEPWFDATRRMRVALDYVRALEPRYPEKLRVRAEERTARMFRWAARTPVLGRRATLAALTRAERMMPTSDRIVEYLRQHAPDVVVLIALTYSRSQQLDLLKAARALGLPVSAAILSWDHLSSKTLIHVVPDQVIVWNEVQRREAIEMHALPADRVVMTGAQCYDQWFTRQPARSRDAFCRAVGLRPDRPFVLWVHSALTPAPDPSEPSLVVRWIEALRRHPDQRLREIGVLVRPHPERVKEWRGVRLDQFPDVAFHGRNPIDAAARDDYFDSLSHSAAVVGLVTTAFVEAAILGRPVLTFTLPEYRMHQEEMIHFRYLTSEHDGPLQLAPDLDTHFGQLASAISSDGSGHVRNVHFLRTFVRPLGLDTPATPGFADALERLHRAGAHPDLSLDRVAWLRPAAAAAAAWSRAGVGRWLMKDGRDDASDDHEARIARALLARQRAKEKRQLAKIRRKTWRQRRDRAMYAGKVVKSTLRRARHRTAVTIYRALYIVGLWRGQLPRGTGHE